MVKYEGYKHNFTRKELQQAVKAFSNLNQAAKSLGCSFGTLSRALQHFKIKVPSRGRPAIHLTKTVLMKYRKGYSWAQIAKALDVSPSKVRQAFQMHGIVKIDARNKKKDYPCES